MSNENPTSTRVSAGALYDNTSAAGEYLFSVMMVAMMFIMLPRAAVSMQRIGKVLDVEPAARYSAG